MADVYIVPCEAFARMAKLKNVRNVYVWIKNGWINSREYQNQKWVVLDDLARRQLEKKVKLDEPRRPGVPGHLLLDAQEPASKEKFGKERLMTLGALEKFFGKSGTEFSRIVLQLKEHKGTWRGMRLFYASSVEAYVDRSVTALKKSKGALKKAQ
jgi:hypothetical protein